MNRTVGAILLMGGTGARFGSTLPKQFHLLGGRPVFTYALETIQKSGLFDEIVLVCHPDWIGEIYRYNLKNREFGKEAAQIFVSGASDHCLEARRE